jgi:hypothetical protein
MNLSVEVIGQRGIIKVSKNELEAELKGKKVKVNDEVI